MKYNGLWADLVPAMIAGHEAGATPVQISDHLRKLEAMRRGRWTSSPSPDIVRYILRREGYIQPIKRKPIPLKKLCVLNDPEGDRLRDQWIDFDWAKMGSI